MYSAPKSAKIAPITNPPPRSTITHRTRAATCIQSLFKFLSPSLLHSPPFCQFLNSTRTHTLSRNGARLSESGLSSAARFFDFLRGAFAKCRFIKLSPSLSLSPSTRLARLAPMCRSPSFLFALLAVPALHFSLDISAPERERGPEIRSSSSGLCVGDPVLARTCSEGKCAARGPDKKVPRVWLELVLIFCCGYICDVDERPLG